MLPRQIVEVTQMRALLVCSDAHVAAGNAPICRPEVEKLSEGRVEEITDGNLELRPSPDRTASCGRPAYRGDVRSARTRASRFACTMKECRAEIERMIAMSIAASRGSG